MALQLLFRQPTRGKIGALELDAILTETHNRTNRVTSFPVEQGSDITDHISEEPVEFNLEGHITNTPVSFGPANTGIVLSVGEQQSRVEAAYELLKEIFQARALITVVSGLEVYTNMAFVNFNIPRTGRTGEVLNFSGTFRQVRIVDSETVLLPNAAADAADKASTNVDTGSNSTKAADAKTAAKAKSKSALAKGFDSFSSLLGGP